MNQPNLIFKKMINKALTKKFKLLCNYIFTSKFLSKEHVLKNGFIYTLYSEKSNLIEVGFTQNNKVLENKLIREKLILLDKKKGSLEELNLLKKTLSELGICIFNKKYYKYSDSSIRHLNTLGWPIGKSLYKQRIIKKKISYAIT